MCWVSITICVVLLHTQVLFQKYGHPEHPLGILSLRSSSVLDDSLRTPRPKDLRLWGASKFFITEKPSFHNTKIAVKIIADTVDFYKSLIGTFKMSSAFFSGSFSLALRAFISKDMVAAWMAGGASV